VQRGGVKIVYDGDGNRVQETVAGVVTRYLTGEVNPTGYVQVMAELSGTNQMLRGYEWGLQLAAVRDFTVNSGGIFHYYGLDGHGSVRFLTSSTGAVTDTYDYDAFGNLISQTGTTVNNYLFAGEQFDPALYHLNQRVTFAQLPAGNHIQNGICQSRCFWRVGLRYSV
jgi:hypothetical protein